LSGVLTPVTVETFAQWKADRAARLLQVAGERLKKK
jgi:hypothetical protein